MIPHNSQKSNEKYSHNGYCYVKDKESADGEKIFWRCDSVLRRVTRNPTRRIFENPKPDSWTQPGATLVI
jgi:hypothetical protein